MGLKFRNGRVAIVNYGAQLTQIDIDLLKKNYSVTEVEEINYYCKGFQESHKPWYLQCVDWVKLIPENLLRDGGYAIKLPDSLPKEVAIYMVIECYSRSGKLPKVMECRNGSFFRIVDLEYEVSFSRNKRRENFNQDNFNVRIHSEDQEQL